jgi:hypothetical protein
MVTLFEGYSTMKNQKQDATRGSQMAAGKTSGTTPSKGPSKTGMPPKQAPKSK